MTNSPQSLIPKTLFSTEFYSPKERMETYRESIGIVFDVDNIEAQGQEFNAMMESFLLDEIMLVETQTVAQNFFITPQKIARSPLDHLLIQIFFDGFTAFKKDGDYQFNDSSTMVVIDSSRPWYAFNPNFRNLTLVVPRRLLQKKLWDYNSHHGRMLNPLHNPFAEILETQMLTLYKNINSIDANMVHAILSHTVEMVVSCLNFSSYAENKRNKNRHSDLRNEIIRAQFEMSCSTLADLFSAKGLTSFAEVSRFKMKYRKFTRLPDPDERYLIRSKAPPAVELKYTSETSHRLWEEWMLSL